jgi:hypothetical protein
MTTLREKTEKMWEDGREAARALVRQHLGHSGVYGDAGSIYTIDLTREARAIEVDLSEVHGRLNRFLEMKAVGPSDEERRSQRQPDIDDQLAAERARAREDRSRGRVLDRLGTRASRGCPNRGPGVASATRRGWLTSAPSSGRSPASRLRNPSTPITSLEMRSRTL